MRDCTKRPKPSISGTDPRKIVNETNHPARQSRGISPLGAHPQSYGDGHASERIAAAISYGKG